MYTEKQKTMRMYICDDELPVLKKQAEKIKSVVPKDDVLEFSSGCALMQRLKEEPCDVLLIDIDMPGLSGLDIAGALNREGHAEKVRPPLLVFVTGHDELVYESLHYHPFGFIRKSYFDKEVEKVLRDCDVWLKTKERRFYFRSEGKDRTLCTICFCQLFSGSIPASETGYAAVSRNFPLFDSGGRACMVFSGIPVLEIQFKIL